MKLSRTIRRRLGVTPRVSRTPARDGENSPSPVPLDPETKKTPIPFEKRPLPKIPTPTPETPMPTRPPNPERLIATIAELRDELTDTATQLRAAQRTIADQAADMAVLHARIDTLRDDNMTQLQRHNEQVATLTRENARLTTLTHELRA